VNADQLIQLAERDPKACVTTCREILSQENGRSADAHRAMGIALRSLGEIEDSIRELQTAHDQYQDQGDAVAAAESTISLAASVAVSGKLEEGVKSLEAVLEHPSESVRAHALVQKAGLIARTGDLRGAMDLYTVAQPVLEKLNDLRWLALLRSTRGMVQTFLGEYESAEVDFVLARDLFIELGRTAAAAEQVQNLGLVAVQRGDIARGLSLMIEAERLCEEAGIAYAETIDTDRAYAYMLAGMPGNAFKVAMTAARGLDSQGRELERAETLYMAARAALAAGDAETADSISARAAQLAAEQDRESWRLMASVVGHEARLRAGMAGEPNDLIELARALSDQGLPSGEMHALALASLRFLETGDLEGAEKCLSSIVANEMLRIELPVQLLLAVARARLELAKGQSQAAAQVLEDATDLIDAHRMLLSATEARAGVSLLADEIAGLGLEAIHDNRTSVISWTERFRGASLRIAPVVMARDTELAMDLAELRGIVRELEAMTLVGEDTSDLTTEVRRLERRIGDLSVAREQNAGAVSPYQQVEQVTDVLGPRRMLYLYDVADRTFGEVVGMDGTRRVELGDGRHIRYLASHLISALRRTFVMGTQRRGQIKTMVAELSGMLLSPLDGVGTDVVVVPPPELLGLPWTAMGRSVDPGLSVTVAPSAGLWARADGLARREESLGVVAGPRLEHAVSEAGRVAEVFASETQQLSGDSATVEATLAAMGRCDRLHAVAHTLLRDDNPMFSSLELADGFLNLYDLEGLESVPDTVVLSACDSAHDNVVGGYEMYGLTSVLLSRGTRSVIATVAPIPDSAESVEAVVRIHTALKEGATAATAVRDAQIGFDDTVDPSVAFVAYGA
jgi:tetratricopeptide (TPR) repeat protein